MTEPKIIKTRFHGISYGSRYEAMWAVFFESLGIPYTSQPEGFVLSGIPYLPDFYLPEQDYILEIKGGLPDEVDLEKGIMLSEDSGKDVFLLYGDVPNLWADEGIRENSGALACNEKLRRDLALRNGHLGPLPRYAHTYHYARDSESYFWTECPKGCSLKYGITKGAALTFCHASALTTIIESL